MSTNKLHTFNGVVRPIDLSGAGNLTHFGGAEEARTRPLEGLKFAAKDLFDVKGYVTGAGNPTWERTHAASGQTAPALEMLLASGANLVAKSCTDELAYSLDGINVHFGVPSNPQDSTRIPGGSSSGSASMVGSKMVDFALGTDTAGSIRVPASFCGVYSLRPTHARISIEGVIPLAPSYDTVGLLCPTASMLRRVGSVLLQEQMDTNLNLKDLELIVLQELFDTVAPDIKEQLLKYVTRFAAAFGKVTYSQFSISKLQQWAAKFRILQAWEIWREHGQWISSCQPHFDHSVASRFNFASTVTDEQRDEALPVRREVLETLQSMLGTNGILCLPPTWNLPPLLTASKEEFDQTRQRNYAFACPASLSGAPQVTLPCELESGFKLGISFLGSPGNDARLIKVAEVLALEHD